MNELAQDRREFSGMVEAKCRIAKCLLAEGSGIAQRTFGESERGRQRFCHWQRARVFAGSLICSPSKSRKPRLPQTILREGPRQSSYARSETPVGLFGA